MLNWSVGRGRAPGAHLGHHFCDLTDPSGPDDHCFRDSGGYQLGLCTIAIHDCQNAYSEDTAPAEPADRYIGDPIVTDRADAPDVPNAMPDADDHAKYWRLGPISVQFMDDGICVVPRIRGRDRIKSDGNRTSPTHAVHEKPWN